MKTKLDRMLDTVIARKSELTLDVSELTSTERAKVKEAAEGRGLHVSGTNKWFLIRDLRGMDGLGATDTSSMDAGRRRALLAKPVRFRGRQMTKAAMIEEMVRAGGVLMPDHFKKYSFNRTAFNRMSSSEAAEYEKKLQIKMPFAVQLPDGSFFEVTKTEAEHFLALQEEL